VTAKKKEDATKTAPKKEAVKELKRDGLAVTLEFTLPTDMFSAAMMGFVQHKGKGRRVPGFRPGHVPFEKLYKMFAHEAIQRVPNMLAKQTSERHLKENSTAVVGRPTYEVTSLPTADKPEDAFVFTLTYQQKPEIVKPSFDALTLEEVEVEVKKDDLDELLKNWMAEGKKTVALKKERPAKQGDVVFVDMTSHIAGEEPRKLEGIEFVLDAQNLGTDLVKKFEGAKVGATIEAKVAIPKSAGDKKMAGKKIPTTYVLRELREFVPLTDLKDLPKALGLKTSEEVEKKAREVLDARGKELAFLWTKRQVFDFLAKGKAFELPKDMLEAEHNKLMAAALQEANLTAELTEGDKKDKGKAREARFKEVFEKTEAQVKTFLKDVAARRVRLGFLLTSLGQELNVQVTEDELKNLMMQEMARHRGREQEVVNFYRKNPQALESLKAPFFEDKTVRALVAKCKTKAGGKISFRDLEARLEKEDNVMAR
jgi:trigger factor